MVSKNIAKQPKAIVEVTVTVPWADLQPKWSEITQKLASEIEIPGFRKGSAPMEMVEPKIASGVQQEVLRVTMPQALIEALQGTDVVPIDYPKYEVIGFSKGQDLVFKATVTERPVVKIGNYKGLLVKKPAPRPITDEQVEKQVEDLFKRWKMRQPQPTPAQQGATPAPAAFSDKPASTTQRGEPDDVFAKAVGALDLADLKKKMRTDLESRENYETELDYEELILQEVEKITQVDIPDILIQDEINRMLVSLQRRVADMGLLLDDYLKGQKKTLDQLKAEWRPQAERNVRMELGLSEIAKLENVVISDSELQAEIDKIQDNRVRAQFETQDPRMHLRHALRQTKTLNLLKSLVGAK